METYVMFEDDPQIENKIPRITAVFENCMDALRAFSAWSDTCPEKIYFSKVIFTNKYIASCVSAIHIGNTVTLKEKDFTILDCARLR